MNIIHSNLYAQGTSKHVLAFNCVQRSHQQIFETFTQTVVSGLVGAVTFPLCTSISTMMYALGESVCFYFESNVVLLVNLQCKNIDTATKKGRYYLSKGYAECEGDASKRYKYPLAKFMWYGFLGNVTLGMASCAMIISGKKTF